MSHESRHGSSAVTTRPTVLAAVLEAPRRLVLQRFDVPAIGEDDALMRVEACGLCGTDHEQWSGGIPAAYPMVPGHESVGIVEEIGPVAAERWGVSAGDRVVVEVFQSCRRCPACVAGHVRACEHHGLTDPYGQIPTSEPPALWGGYAEYQYLAPDAMVQRVPAELQPEVAALANAVAAGCRWGVSVAGTGPGHRVAVLGPGIRGLSAAVAARDAGAAFVLVAGRGARDAGRLAAARTFGADIVVDVTEEDPVAVLREATGGHLADVVIDVTANAPEAFVQAIELAEVGGTIVVAGTRGTQDVPAFRPDRIVVKQLRIQGTVGVDSRDYQAAIALLSSGRFPFGSLPRRAVGLHGLEELLAVMAGEREDPPPLFGVVVPWQ